MAGDHIHVIRHHDGFLSAFAARANRIERVSLPEIAQDLQRNDRFIILKVDGGSIAETLLLGPKDPVEILPTNDPEDGLFGVTSKALVQVIALLDAMGHADVNAEDDDE